MVKIKNIRPAAILLLICVLLAGCTLTKPVENNTANRESYRDTQNAAETIKFRRKSSEIDYSNIAFTPWDIVAASKNIAKQETKPYTIMVYMNGSDLESEDGAATMDIIEMLDSGVKSENVNIMIFTGGTNRWQNDVIPSNSCMLWRISDGYIEELADVGLKNMGDPGTLSSFIDFSIKNFPAEKYGLVFWDHGGGSIAGYGHDEKFGESYLTLLEINYALEASVLPEEATLEFLGFDACLMATVEMAVVASDYARYFIASEDLEPGEGWDYSFLAELNGAPDMDGGQLGTIIIDYFVDYYGADSDSALSLSVIDLSKAEEVMERMGYLMYLCSDNLNDNESSAFRTFAKKRAGTKTFGNSNPRDSDCDMVDIGDMAHKLSDIFPEEANALLGSLNSAVIYSRHNSDTALYGLTAYYIYSGKRGANNSLKIYDGLNMSTPYTDYLYQFARILTGGQYRTSGKTRSGSAETDIIERHATLWKPYDSQENTYMLTASRRATDGLDLSSWNPRDELLPYLNGMPVCLYENGGTNTGQHYTIPAEVEGHPCDIVVLINEKYPEGKILGVRREEGKIIQKGFDPIRAGDSVIIYYDTIKLTDGKAESLGFIKGKPFTAGESTSLEWRKPEGGDYFRAIVSTDFTYNKHYSEFLKVS